MLLVCKVLRNVFFYEFCLKFIKEWVLYDENDCLDFDVMVRGEDDRYRDLFIE